MKKTVVSKQTKIFQFIDFFVGDEEYAIELHEVREIIRVPDITPLPQTARFVKGVINLRGTVIPVIDLRLRFNCGKSEFNPLTRAIIVALEDKLIGLVVDNVSRVIRINDDELSPPPEKIGGISKEYIKGVGKINSGLIIILDHKRILTSEEHEIIKELEE